MPAKKKAPARKRKAAPKRTARRAGKRTAQAAAHDRAEIARLYFEGMGQAAIAEEIGISQPTVCRDLAVLHDQWRQEGVKKIDAYISRELARIDRLEQMYFDAWERSQEDAVTNTEEMGGQYGVRSVEKIEGRDGSAQFLGGVQWCIERRCKLLGLDAPKRTISVTSDDPNDLVGGIPASRSWATEAVALHESK